MMRWVKVEDVGDTTFLLESKWTSSASARRMIASSPMAAAPQRAVRSSSVSPRRRSRPIRSSPPRASRKPPASSREAAVAGKVDYLRGLKKTSSWPPHPRRYGPRALPQHSVADGMPAPSPVEEIPEAAELTAEEAAALDFLQKDTERTLLRRAKPAFGRFSARPKTESNGVQ